ncbi:MAG TPA: hypothetical protein VGI70_14600, partial [Polyangiales bacterium]
MQRVVDAIAELYQRALETLRVQVTEGGKLHRGKLEGRQVAAHALAYLATELEAARQMAAWATRLGGAYEKRLAAAYIGEVARSAASAIELGPCESVDVHELGVSDEDIRRTVGSAEVLAFIAEHARSDHYIAIAKQAKDVGYGALGLDDSVLEDIRS